MGERRENKHYNENKGFFSDVAAYGAGAGHYPPSHWAYTPPPPGYPSLGHGYSPAAYPPPGHGYSPAGYPPPAPYPPPVYPPPSGYPPSGYPHPSHSGSRLGGLLAGAAAAAAYGGHHMGHGGYHPHGGYFGHHHGRYKHGKFKHGKFGKRWKHQHGMLGGKFKKFKKWK